MRENQCVTTRTASLLDEQERHFLIPAPSREGRLFLRMLPARRQVDARTQAVLYLHGATFPSALSIAFRFDGYSWRDALCDAGFDVWGLDFLGFGESDRYPEMDQPSAAHAPLCVATDAAQQAEAAVRFVLEQSGLRSVSLISHSWGSMAAGRLAGTHPELVNRIVMFAPIARREALRNVPRPDGPAWRIVTVEDQWKRFVEDVPAGQPPVLSRTHFDEWAQCYLDSDAQSRLHNPVGVKTPSGPRIEVLRAWQGELAWEPEKVEAPVAIIRGGWDSLVTDADARWLTSALTRSREKRDIKIDRGTHLMHLEAMRFALWSESITFLLGNLPSYPNSGHAGCAVRRSLGGTTVNDHHTPDIPGYNFGTPDVAKSPISLEALKELQASTLFTDEDVVYLRLSYAVLKDQAEDLVTMWRGIIALHPHLSGYGKDQHSGVVDQEYGAKVGRRFAQWVLDTARAEYDQDWLNYQYEIGLRHHRTKKNLTDGAHTATHIRGRDLIAFAAATVAPMRPYLEKGGHSSEVVNRMQQAWWKSMILQVTLWSQPYMNHGDF
jgi:pimeloyl-ACP methyl ester carboxylesterase